MDNVWWLASSGAEARAESPLGVENWIPAEAGC